MKTPLQDRSQDHEYTELIKKIDEIALKANTNILDMEAKYRNNIKTPELLTLRTSLTSIEDRIAAAYTTLRAWTASNTETPIEANVSQTRFTIYRDKKTHNQKGARETAKA